MSTDPPSTGLETARRALERERRRLREERRAFERFARRVTNLEAAAGVTQQPVAGPATCVSATPSNGIPAVRDAYAETVLSISHYEEMYDDTWLESIAAECNEELAAALEQHAELYPQLKRSLIAAARQAATNREQLLEAVEAERESVGRFHRKLSATREDVRSLLDQPLEQLEFNALRLTRARLLELEDRCDALATERQKGIRRRRQHLMTADIDELGQFLYGECGCRHPVLSEIAALGERIERGRQRVERALATAT